MRATSGLADELLVRSWVPQTEICSAPSTPRPETALPSPRLSETAGWEGRAGCRQRAGRRVWGRQREGREGSETEGKRRDNYQKKIKKNPLHEVDHRHGLGGGCSGFWKQLGRRHMGQGGCKQTPGVLCRRQALGRACIKAPDSSVKILLATTPRRVWCGCSPAALPTLPSNA